MVSTTFGDVGTRESPGRSVLRRFLGRLLAARDSHVRRTVHGHRIGFDDARLALIGYGRKSVDFAGRGQFPM
jgi:hypothetical protein